MYDFSQVSELGFDVFQLLNVVIEFVCEGGRPTAGGEGNRPIPMTI